jgi:hypothetical protein
MPSSAAAQAGGFQHEVSEVARIRSLVGWLLTSLVHAMRQPWRSDARKQLVRILGMWNRGDQCFELLPNSGDEPCSSQLIALPVGGGRQGRWERRLKGV